MHTKKIVTSIAMLTQPRVPVVLSVADTIALEYTFALVPKPWTGASAG